MTNISRAEHAVNVGISDAYYVDKLGHYHGSCKLSFTNDFISTCHSSYVQYSMQCTKVLKQESVVINSVISNMYK